MKINFFFEDVSFVLKDKGKLRLWIAACIAAEGFRLKQINFIFCSDEYLLDLNKKFLNHDYFTDVITFSHESSNISKEVGGDVFISYHRITDNALKLKIPESNEIHRVMVHGVLHLMGYKDKTKADKNRMSALEDDCLLRRSFDDSNLAI